MSTILCPENLKGGILVGRLDVSCFTGRHHRPDISATLTDNEANLVGAEYLQR